MKIFSLIQEKTSSLFISSKRTKVTKKNRKNKKLQLLSIQKISETMTTTATPIIKTNKKIGTPVLPNSKRFIHIFNRINSSIGQYRSIKKRYSISSCSLSVSVFIIR